MTAKKAPASSTTTVYHPTLRASYEVDAATLKNWTKSGWLLEQPDYDSPAANLASAEDESDTPSA